MIRTRLFVSSFLCSLALLGAGNACGGSDITGSGSNGKKSDATDAGVDGEHSSSSDGGDNTSANSTGGQQDAATNGIDNGGTGDNDSGTASQADVAKVCQEECSGDGDCSEGFDCTQGRCVATAEPECSGDGVCVADASNWMSACSKQADCLLPGTSCIDIGDGNGRCATEPSGAAPCSSLGLEEIDMPVIEGGDEVTVCGDSTARCEEGECGYACVEGSCPDNFECNQDSGDCECANDRACAGLPNVSVCVAGRCECADDGDCSTNANVCVDGTCGCTDDSVCKGDATHPGTSWVCETH